VPPRLFDVPRTLVTPATYTTIAAGPGSTPGSCWALLVRGPLLHTACATLDEAVSTPSLAAGGTADPNPYGLSGVGNSSTNSSISSPWQPARMSSSTITHARLSRSIFACAARKMVFHHGRSRLKEVCGVAHVRREFAVAASDAVYLNSQAYRNTQRLQLFGELDRSGSPEALPVDNERRAIRFITYGIECLSDEILGDVPASVLEGLYIDVTAWVAKTECNLASPLLFVVPRIASTQESHNDAGAIRNGARRLYVGQPDTGTGNDQ